MMSRPYAHVLVEPKGPPTQTAQCERCHLQMRAMTLHEIELLAVAHGKVCTS